MDLGLSFEVELLINKLKYPQQSHEALIILYQLKNYLINHPESLGRKFFEEIVRLFPTLHLSCQLTVIEIFEDCGKKFDAVSSIIIGYLLVLLNTTQYPLNKIILQAIYKIIPFIFSLRFIIITNIFLFSLSI
jgi:hypothetical protein